jgi:hypothetical protein
MRPRPESEGDSGLAAVAEPTRKSACEARRFFGRVFLFKNLAMRKRAASACMDRARQLL